MFHLLWPMFNIISQLTSFLDKETVILTTKKPSQRKEIVQSSKKIVTSI